MPSLIDVICGKCGIKSAFEERNALVDSISDDGSNRNEIFGNDECRAQCRAQIGNNYGHYLPPLNDMDDVNEYAELFGLEYFDLVVCTAKKEKKKHLELIATVQKLGVPGLLVKVVEAGKPLVHYQEVKISVQNNFKKAMGRENVPKINVLSVSPGRIDECAGPLLLQLVAEGFAI